MGEFEEQYMDVLQNIEFALVKVYQEEADMSDFDALQAVNGLIRTYQAEARGRDAPVLRLKPLQQAAFDSVQSICEWRLGRGELETQSGELVDLALQPLDVSEIIACLKRVRKSIQLWQKEGGRRGYYEFVSGFVQ